MAAIIIDFVDYLKVRKRYSVATQSNYIDALVKFYQYIYPEEDLSSQIFEGKLEQLKSLENDNPSEFIKVLSFNNFRGFIADSLDKQISPVTINLYMSALSTFCKYLVKKEILEQNPVKNIYRPKQQKRLPQFYSQEVLNSFLNTAVDDNYANIRDRMIFTLIYDTGMRRAEVVNLKVKNVDLNRGVFDIIGKGDKEREIPIVEVLKDKIIDYLSVREDFIAQIESKYESESAKNKSQGECRVDKEYFFISNRGTKLYLSFINKVISEQMSGNKSFSGKKSPHILRHSFATALLNNGADLFSIKEVLGHSSLAATEVYTHNSFEKLKKIYLTAHPRANRGSKEK